MDVALGAGIVALAAAIFWSRGLNLGVVPLLVGPLLVVPLAGRSLAPALGGLAALPLLSTMVWWDAGSVLGPWRLGGFIVAGFGIAALARLVTRDAGRATRAIVLILLGAVGIVSASSTGVYAAPTAFWVLWHHWSAYIAPVEGLLSGGIPYRDFLVQYGIGPTLLIAAACGEDCWTGMYAVVAATNTLHLLALGGCVLIIARPAAIGATALAVLALVAAVTLWTAYPPDWLGGLATPSVGGLRYLPVSALLLRVLRNNRRGVVWDGWETALWLLGLLWSPEAAYCVTLIRWPCLALRMVDGGRATGVRAVAPVLRCVGQALGTTVLALAAASFAFRLWFGDWPSLAGYLTYVANPPGALSPNLLGPMWLAVGAALAAMVAMVRGSALNIRQANAALLGLMAAACYFLGRSHDNNILNILPFLVVSLTAAAVVAGPRLIGGFARTVMAGIVAWGASLGGGGWLEVWRSGKAFEIGPSRLLSRIGFEGADAATLLDRHAGLPAGRSAEAAAALAWVRSRGEGAPVLVSATMLLPRHPAGEAWTGVNNVANYSLLPPAIMERVVRRGARRFARPGWLVIEDGQSASWLATFTASYEVTERHQTGAYTAYRLAPRCEQPRAARQVSPAMPPEEAAGSCATTFMRRSAAVPSAEILAPSSSPSRNGLGSADR